MGRRERFFQCRLTEVQELCGLVKHLKFEREDGAAFQFSAGQFVMVHFPNGEGVEINRSYSMSAPLTTATPGRFALCVKRVEGGQGSELLHALCLGESLKCSGPYGRFVLPATPPKEIILVATGTGVAPYRAMLPSLEVLMREGHRVWLLFGVRYSEELLYDTTWRELAERWPARFMYRPVVSRPLASWEGEAGYVSAMLPELLSKVDVSDAIAYLCGVPAMIDNMKEALLSSGFTRRTIKTEKYTSPPPPGRKISLPGGS